MKINSEPTGAAGADRDATGLRFVILTTEFNAPIVDALREGASRCLLDCGAAPDDIVTLQVPGAWELPLAARKVAGLGSFDAIVALGCVIRGETAHFEFVARGAIDGLQRVALDSGIPIGLGVLTTENEAQAWARTGGSEGNKGEAAALAALDMIRLIRLSREWT